MTLLVIGNLFVSKNVGKALMGLADNRPLIPLLAYDSFYSANPKKRLEYVERGTRFSWYMYRT